MGGVKFMADELRLDLVFQMAQAIDNLLLSWEPRPSLNEAISAHVQSLARALAHQSGFCRVCLKNPTTRGADPRQIYVPTHGRCA